MIEAVNSVLSNAQYTRAVAEQQSVTNSYAANPERVQQASTQAPYISLYIKVDTNFDKAILQIRDSDTGDVVRQIPTESQLEAYRRAQTSNAVRERVATDVTDRVIIKDDKAEQSAAPVKADRAPEPEAAPAPVKAQVSSSARVSTPAPAPQAAPVSVDTQA